MKREFNPEVGQLCYRAFFDEIRGRMHIECYRLVKKGKRNWQCFEKQVNGFPQQLKKQGFFRYLYPTPFAALQASLSDAEFFIVHFEDKWSEEEILPYRKKAKACRDEMELLLS